MSSVLSINESHLSLDSLLIRDIAVEDLGSQMMKEWFPQIQKQNISSLLAGFEPIKFVFRLRDASVSLAQGESDSSNFGRTVYVETFRSLSNLLVGTGNVVAKAAPTATHVKARSPKDLSEGLKMAGEEIVRGFMDGVFGVFVTPVEKYYETGSTSDAILQVCKGMPGLVLKPVRGLLVGSAIPLRAAAAAADPSIQERARLKYKTPEASSSANNLMSNDSNNAKNNDEDNNNNNNNNDANL